MPKPLTITRDALSAMQPCDLDSRLALFGCRKTLGARQALAADTANAAVYAANAAANAADADARQKEIDAQKEILIAICELRTPTSASLVQEIV